MKKENDKSCNFPRHLTLAIEVIFLNNDNQLVCETINVNFRIQCVAIVRQSTKTVLYEKMTNILKTTFLENIYILK